jgi:hypothetical protein
MPVPFTPLTAFVILLGAVFPPIREVVKAGVKHGSRDIRGRRGIMKDAWLEAAEGIGLCEGSQGVLFLPARIIVEFLEISQVFGQVSNVIVGSLEALHFRAESIVSFLLDGEVDHGCEGLSRVEGIRFFACKDSSGVGVLPRPEGTRMIEAVTPPREEKLRVIQEKVVSEKGGVNRLSSQSRDGIIVLRGYPVDAALPVRPRYDPEFFGDFGGRRAWTIVEIRGW